MLVPLGSTVGSAVTFARCRRRDGGRISESEALEDIFVVDCKRSCTAIALRTGSERALGCYLRIS